MAQQEQEAGEQREAPMTPEVNAKVVPQSGLLPALSASSGVQDQIKPSTADRPKPSTAEKSKPSIAEKVAKPTTPAPTTPAKPSRPVTAIDVTEGGAPSTPDQAAAGPDAASGPLAFLASPSGAKATGAPLQTRSHALPSMQTAMLLSPRGELSSNKGVKAVSSVTFSSKAQAKSAARPLELDPSTSSFLMGAPGSTRTSQTFGPHPAGSLHPQPAEVRHQLTAALATINPMALSIPSANLNALNQQSGGLSPRPGLGLVVSRPAVSAAAADRPVTPALAPGAGPALSRPYSSAPGNGVAGAQPPASPRLNSPAINSLSLGAVGGRKLPSSCSRSGVGSRGSSRGGMERLARDGVLAKRPHPMEGFRPSRAQLLVVFNSIDADKTGKLTQANLEEACISLGFSLQNARSLYERLDVGRKGFVTHAEWGNSDLRNTIEMFTLNYMRQFLGLPDTSASPVEVQNYFRQQEQSRVKSLPVALDLMRANAITRGSKASMRTGDAIYDAFCFIDSDHSGTLSKAELVDGFSVMGVRIAESVADEILRLFDRNGNGTVEYSEFVRTMFSR